MTPRGLPQTGRSPDTPPRSRGKSAIMEVAAVPWLKTSPELERAKFIAAVETSEESFASICRSFGISRETGYKWCRRFEEGGLAALMDRKPLAYHHPNATPAHIEDRIVALRKEHPTWGPKKLKARLEQLHPGEVFPAASTIGEILVRRGCIAPRKRRLRVPPSGVSTSSYTGPNAVWCVDHKGHFPLADGTRCGPLTLMDGFSRYLLRCETCTSTSEKEARPHLELAFRQYGLPVALRSDGGVPFASANTPGRLTGLAVWFIKLGIELHRNDPGKPQQNGRLERFHRTLEEAIAGGPYTREVQQRRFDALRKEYNFERPHEALGQKTPASVYETSWRPYPAVVKSPEYVDDRAVRRVDDRGRIRWRGHELYFGRPLADEPVFFHEVGDARWDVYFGQHFLLTVETRGEKARVTYEAPKDDPERRPPPIRRP